MWSYINLRPLTYQPENPEDSIANPYIFVVQNYSSKITDTDEDDANHFRKRLRYRANLLEQLRMRFLAEYLAQRMRRPRQISQLSDSKL